MISYASTKVLEIIGYKVGELQIINTAMHPSTTQQEKI